MLIYYSNQNNINKKSYDCVVCVHKGIAEKQELFDLFSSQLKFPSYFGNNWDALYDCLSDLSWLNHKSVLILHEDLPLRNAKREMEIYIKLISDLEKATSEEYVKIDLAFSQNNRSEIESIMSMR